MKSRTIFAFVALLLSHSAVKAGEVKTECILIQAYDPAKFVNQTVTEADIVGWGPGPGAATAPLPAPAAPQIPTAGVDPLGSNLYPVQPPEPANPDPVQPPEPASPETAQEGQDPVYMGTGGPSNNPCARLHVPVDIMAALRYRRYPPGPNPPWGLWEWESDTGTWAIEVDKRKKRHAPGYTGMTSANFTDPCMAAGGPVMAALRDESKPPTLKPKDGKWEWDDNAKLWELEPNKRRKRQAPGTVLRGTLSCDPGTIIHVERVSRGFSITDQCQPVRHPCQASSPLAQQVAHCEGKTGACEVNIQQKFLPDQCGRLTNFALVKYECIADSERQNICEPRTLQSTGGSLVINSPVFSGRNNDADLLMCECTLSSIGELSTAFTFPWIKTTLAPKDSASCVEDMLLIDTKDSVTKRFTNRHEQCGSATVRDKSYVTSSLRLVYIPSGRLDSKNGFLLKVQGSKDTGAEMRVVCTAMSIFGTRVQPSPVAPPPPSLAPPPPSINDPPTTPFSAPKAPAPVAPFPIFSTKSLPTFSSESSPSSSASSDNTTGADQTSAAGDTLSNQTANATDQGLNAGGVAGAIFHNGEQGANVAESGGGVLSGVFATLGSLVIVIGALVFFLWQRNNRMKNRNDPYDAERNCSNQGLYSDNAAYQDPAYQGNTSRPASVHAPASNSLRSARAAFDPEASQGEMYSNESFQQAQNVSSGGRAPPPIPPALPARPSRPKKESCRSLKSEEEEDVTYDNPAAAPPSVSTSAALPVIREACHVNLDKDYASLDEISVALSSQDASEGGSEGTRKPSAVVSINGDPESAPEVEIQTEA